MSKTRDEQIDELIGAINTVRLVVQLQAAQLTRLESLVRILECKAECQEKTTNSVVAFVTDDERLDW